MTWLRAPNNARAMREVEADLGPIIGQLEPMRPLPRRNYGATPRWIERGLQAVIGWCAVAAWAGVILVWLWLAFIVLASTKPARAQPYSEIRIKIDCTPDALTYCKAAIPHGRDAIIACMVGNKDKLRQRCLRHFW